MTSDRYCHSSTLGRCDERALARVSQAGRETFVFVMLAVFFPLVFGMLAFLGASEAKARTTFLANLPYFDDRAVLLIDGRQIEHSAELMEDLRRSMYPW